MNFCMIFLIFVFCLVILWDGFSGSNIKDLGLVCIFFFKMLICFWSFWIFLVGKFFWLFIFWSFFVLRLRVLKVFEICCILVWKLVLEILVCVRCVKILLWKFFKLLILDVIVGCKKGLSELEKRIVKKKYV